GPLPAVGAVNVSRSVMVAAGSSSRPSPCPAPTSGGDVRRVRLHHFFSKRRGEKEWKKGEAGGSPWGSLADDVHNVHNRGDLNVTTGTLLLPPSTSLLGVACGGVRVAAQATGASCPAPGLSG